MRRSLNILQLARQKDAANRCKLLGAHIEGPFLSKAFKGAHEIEFLCEPSLTSLHERIQGFENEISIVTLAP